MGGFCRQSSSSTTVVDNRNLVHYSSHLVLSDLSLFHHQQTSYRLGKVYGIKPKHQRHARVSGVCPRMNDSHRRGRDANSFLPEGTNNKQTTGHHRLRLKASSESLYGILEKSLLWEYGACNYYLLR